MIAHALSNPYKDIAGWVLLKDGGELPERAGSQLEGRVNSKAPKHKCAQCVLGIARSVLQRWGIRRRRDEVTVVGVWGTDHSVPWRLSRGFCCSPREVRAAAGFGAGEVTQSSLGFNSVLLAAGLRPH